MKIETYDSRRGTIGYRLIAETKREKLVLGSLRNGAYFTDGKFMYEGSGSKGRDSEDELISEVAFSHNRPLEQRVSSQLYTLPLQSEQ